MLRSMYTFTLFYCVAIELRHMFFYKFILTYMHVVTEPEIFFSPTDTVIVCVYNFIIKKIVLYEN